MINRLLKLLIITITIIGCNNNIGKEYYPDGTLKSEFKIRENEKNGFAKWYYPNGNVEIEGNFINNKKNGLFKQYYETGEIETECFFKDGLQHGRLVSYFKNGDIYLINNFFEGDQKGDMFEYYPNGQLLMDSYYQDDSTITFYRKYDSLGNIIDEYRIITEDIPKFAENEKECLFSFNISGPKIKIEDSVIFELRVYEETDVYWDDLSESYQPNYFLVDTIILKSNDVAYKFIPKNGGKQLMFNSIFIFNSGKQNEIILGNMEGKGPFVNNIKR
jgi:hypothetical protein